MSEMILKPATRQGVRPLIAVYGESGSGKTMSSLLLARGFVGPSGRIGMIDTESGRGSLYADVIQGGYDVLELREPFSPMRHIEAIQAVEKSGVTIGVLDSGSLEWDGLGGVLSLADESEHKSGKPGLHNWRQPKMDHARFVLKLLQSPIPWIICLRAKYKTRQGKEAGKTVIVKDDFPTPIQDEGFIYEATVHGLIDTDHKFILRKSSHPDLRRCLPNNEPVTMDHGKLLAQWCASAGGTKNGNGELEHKRLKKQLWDLTADKHDGDPNRLFQHLIDEVFISDTETLETLTTDRLKDVIKAIKETKEKPV